jgi:hypothetical protein
MQLATNRHGHLYLAEPRKLYQLVAGVMAVAALLIAVWIWAEPGPIPDQPDWYRPFAFILSAMAAAGMQWWAQYGPPIEFDQKRRAVVRGQRIIVPYADISEVAIRTVRYRNREFYRVILRGHASRQVDLGPVHNDMDASSIAAQIATAIDKPVHLAPY